MANTTEKSKFGARFDGLVTRHRATLSKEERAFLAEGRAVRDAQFGLVKAREVLHVAEVRVKGCEEELAKREKAAEVTGQILDETEKKAAEQAKKTSEEADAES